MEGSWPKSIVDWEMSTVKDICENYIVPRVETTYAHWIGYDDDAGYGSAGVRMALLVSPKVLNAIHEYWFHNDTGTFRGCTHKFMANVCEVWVTEKPELLYELAFLVDESSSPIALDSRIIRCVPYCICGKGLNNVSCSEFGMPLMTAVPVTVGDGDMICSYGVPELYPEYTDEAGRKHYFAASKGYTRCAIVNKQCCAHTEQ